MSSSVVMITKNNFFSVQLDVFGENSKNTQFYNNFQLSTYASSNSIIYLNHEKDGIFAKS